ncbi:hypothetical protein NMG60_11008001 [Bertholletia excelsa]
MAIAHQKETGQERQTMAKRFKLRISRVIPSFQSCRSKDPSILPEEPVPPFFRLSPTAVHVDLRPTTPPLPKPPRSSFKRHVSSALGCGLRSKSGPQCSSDEDHTDSPPEFKWQREDKWHVVAKRRSSRKKKTVPRFRISTSSAESGLFSSDGYEEETETLVSSSRSFSTDSSPLEAIHEAPPASRRHKKKKVKRSSARRSTSSKVKISVCRSSSVSSPESGSSPARLSVFKRMIPCRVEGKVKESFAVVKRSEDPYEDFKRSMKEMIVEKHMYEEADLEQLLLCFLSLNSRRHHRVIVQAFTEIWECMFCARDSTSHGRSSFQNSVNLKLTGHD